MPAAISALFVGSLGVAIESMTQELREHVSPAAQPHLAEIRVDRATTKLAKGALTLDPYDAAMRAAI